MRYLFFLIGLILVFPWIGQTSSMNHLVISQVQVEGDGGSSDEFIEIYNPTSSAISINGWSLQYKSSSGNFPLTSGKKNLPDATVAAGGYFLIAHNSYNGSVTADHAHSSFALSGTASGATVFLVNTTTFISSSTDASIIDRVGYGSSANNSPEGTSTVSPASEQSIIRSSDTDNNLSDFSLGASNPRNSSSSGSTPIPPGPPPPSPTPTPPPPEPPLVPVITYSSYVIISELLVNPDGPDSGEEWIELFNSYSGEIDLSGWKLDDEGISGTVGSSAYTLPEETVIAPNSFLVISLPENAFTLNNTGGDTFRLIWPNNQVASQITYTETAPDDQAYARKADNNFAWTKIVTKGNVNTFSATNPTPITGEASDDLKIKINEIFPNPTGADSGLEWVELLNTGTIPTSLNNWILDDESVSGTIGSNAYKIESIMIDPGKIALIPLPAGAVALNNSGKETVRVFNANKILIDSIPYENAKENESYALIEGSWVWSMPTPNDWNKLITEQKLPEVIIHEIFPEPQQSGEEFIELLNVGSVAINLSNWVISDNASKYPLVGVLEPGKFFLVKKSESKLALNNSGQETITLVDDKGKVFAEVEYEDAPKNQSYNYVKGKYVWSTVVTPGNTNQIKGVQATKVETTPQVDLVESEVMPTSVIAQVPLITEILGPDLGAQFVPQIAGAQTVEGNVFAKSTGSSFGSYFGLSGNLTWLASGFVSGIIFCYALFRIHPNKTL